MRLRVAFLPSQIAARSVDVAIVVDVIRATTSLVSLFDAGCHSVWIATSADDPVGVRSALGPGSLLFGEDAEGAAPPGYNHEPSPVGIAALDLSTCKAAFLNTANGTPAIVSALDSGATVVLIGALRNLEAVTRQAASEASKRGTGISIICSGQRRNSQVALEDVYCAGKIVSRLLDLGVAGSADLEDSARVALTVAATHAESDCPVTTSMTGERFIRFGRHEDVAFCAQVDQSVLVPSVAANGVVPTHPVRIHHV